MRLSLRVYVCLSADLKSIVIHRLRPADKLSRILEKTNRFENFSIHSVLATCSMNDRVHCLCHPTFGLPFINAFEYLILFYFIDLKYYNGLGSQH